LDVGIAGLKKLVTFASPIGRKGVKEEKREVKSSRITFHFRVKKFIEVGAADRLEAICGGKDK